MTITSIEVRNINKKHNKYILKNGSVRSDILVEKNKKLNKQKDKRKQINVKLLKLKKEN